MSLNTKGLTIMIEGCIGVGKSTFSKVLNRLLCDNGTDSQLLPETIEPSLLSLYLGNMKVYAFSFQVIVATQRCALLKEARHCATKGSTVVIDRGIMGDMAFAAMQAANELISKKEYAVYRDLISHARKACHKPRHACIVYLQCKPSVAFERMKNRNRKGEADSYTLDYFKRLHDAHETMIEEARDNGANVITLDWNAPQTEQSIRSHPGMARLSKMASVAASK